MKKFIFILALITLIFLPQQVSAHVLLTDGSIGAIVHINPDDDPLLSQPTDLFFEFKDKKKQFDSTKCTCTFTVIQQGKKIYSQPLFSTNQQVPTEAHVTYTFLKRDIYTVKVTGTPTEEGLFQPFQLSYDIRVTREAKNQSSTNTSWVSTHIIHLWGVGAIFLFVIFAFIKQTIQAKRR